MLASIVSVLKTLNVNADVSKLSPKLKQAVSKAIDPLSFSS